MASYLYDSLQPSSQYYDRKSDLTEVEYKKRLETTATVYVGNLHCSTSESALYEIFGRAGQVKDIIMGVTKEGIFAGFCFVIYQTHEEAGVAVEYISSSKQIENARLIIQFHADCLFEYGRLYDRVIRVDWDYGFKEGRQYGRGIDGYQKRDQYRQTNDSGRHNIHGHWKEQQKQQYQQQQSSSSDRQYGYANNRDNRGGYKGNYNNRDGSQGYGNKEGYRGRSGGHGGFNNYNSGEGGFIGSSKYKKSYKDFKNEQVKQRTNREYGFVVEYLREREIEIMDIRLIFTHIKML